MRYKCLGDSLLHKYEEAFCRNPALVIIGMASILPNWHHQLLADESGRTIFNTGFIDPHRAQNLSQNWKLMKNGSAI
jgi:hypothetical protein